MFIATVIVSVILALILLAAGASKVFNSESAQKTAAHLAVPGGLYGAIGVCEGSAGIALFVGLYWRPVAVAALIGVLLLMFGAIVTHRKAGDGVKEAVPAVVVLLLAAAALALTLAEGF